MLEIESNVIFLLDNICLSFSIMLSVYFRLKYKRFGNIPKWWEKLGWLLMTMLVISAIGDSIKALMGTLTINNIKGTRLLIALYFLWYAFTLFLARRKTKHNLRDTKTGKFVKKSIKTV